MSQSAEQALEQALALHRAGRYAEAEAFYRQALEHEPDHPELLHLLGVAVMRLGRHREAADLIGRAISIDDEAGEYHANLASALLALGHAEQGLSSAQRAVALGPDLAEAQGVLGIALAGMGRPGEALAALQKALSLRPEWPEMLVNLGSVLKELDRLDEAESAYRAALAMRPSIVEAHSNLGAVLADLGRLDEAISECRAALRLNPQSAQAYNNLGYAMNLKGDLDGAAAECRRAIALQPVYPEALVNLAIVLAAQCKWDESLAACCEALAARPDFALAHWNLGLNLLKKGEYALGWPHWEWRFAVGKLGIRRREFPQPRWDGSRLMDRRILLNVEQGLGDAIQFARFVPMVATRGGRIVVECAAELRRLFGGLAGVEQVVEQGEALPEFDMHCPMPSLPLVFGTTLQTIPANAPYLSVDASSAESWRTRLANLGSGRKVGLVWAGNSRHTNDRNRSIPLATLAPLGAVEDVHLISLQKGLRSVDAVTPPAGLKLIDWTSELGDLADTAALMAGLDLIISVDTAPAHLAGALGRPVWILLPFSADWRWLRQGDESPWYPTMRLFRQAVAGEWGVAVERLVTALRDFVAADRR
jgi:Flp pilus assembly protein TadD